MIERAWCKECMGLRPVQVIAGATRQRENAHHVTGYLSCSHHFSVITSDRGVERMREQVRP